METSTLESMTPCRETRDSPHPNEIMFGQQRLRELLTELADRSPAAVVEGVFAAVDAHAAAQAQSDDITCLALRYDPQAYRAQDPESLDSIGMALESECL